MRVCKIPSLDTQSHVYQLDTGDWTIITVSTLKEDVLLKQERLLQKSFEHNSGFSKIHEFFLEICFVENSTFFRK